MGWTNKQTYISILFLFILVITSFVKVGIDLSNNERINLNDENINYINQIQGSSISSGFEEIADTSIKNSSQVGLLDSEDNKSVLPTSDFLSTLYVMKERALSFTKLLSFLYNLPSITLIMLRAPISEFSHIINIIGYFLAICLIIVIWNWVGR